MSSKTITVLQIGIAMIFASAILVSSYLGGGDTTTYLFVALWFIPFSWLAAKQQKLVTKKNCIR